MMKILVAEDDSLLRQMYLDTFQASGYTIDTAVDGEDAYTKLKIGGYDLALVDIIMPKIDGLSVIKKLKAEAQPAINKKIVFLSNLDNEEQKKQALELGDGYIIKSDVNPGELLAQIKQYLPTA